MYTKIFLPPAVVSKNCISNYFPLWFYIIEDAVTITLLCILAIKIKKFCEIDQQVSTIQRQPRQKFCSTNITINSIVV